MASQRPTACSALPRRLADAGAGTWWKDSAGPSSCSPAASTGCAGWLTSTSPAVPRVLSYWLRRIRRTRTELLCPGPRRLPPAIGPAAFEVGTEVRAAFLQAARTPQRAQTDACFVPSEARPGHYFADLYALARLRLAALGPEGVFGGGFCTFAEHDRFFSYRRDGRTGRMASVILLQ